LRNKEKEIKAKTKENKGRGTRKIKKNHRLYNKRDDNKDIKVKSENSEEEKGR
jgi:hypothetical protein